MFVTWNIVVITVGCKFSRFYVDHFPVNGNLYFYISSLKPWDQLELNLEGMFIGWSYYKIGGLWEIFNNNKTKTKGP